jgi:hypothetical protein
MRNRLTTPSPTPLPRKRKGDPCRLPSNGGEGENQSRPLSTNSAWSNFGKWADKLDAVEYRQIVHLWEHGYVRDVPAFAKQLAAALKKKAPKAKSARRTIEDLLAAANEASKADYLAVTNGIESATNDEDEFDEEAADYDPK